MNKRSTRKPKPDATIPHIYEAGGQNARINSDAKYGISPVPSFHDSLTVIPDGMTKQDPESPSGISMYKLGQWIPLVLAPTIKKKKKGKLTKNDFIKARKEEEARIEQEKKEEIEKRNQEFHDYLISMDKDKRLCVITLGFGYAVVTVKRKLMVQNTNDKSPFQPYERTEEQVLHVTSMLRWGTPLQWDNISDALLNYDIKNVIVTSHSDVDKFIEKE